MLAFFWVFKDCTICCIILRVCIQFIDFCEVNMKILSIDGGGIKGLLTASFFATLEERLNERNLDNRKFISDYFDLIVGTSTGGMIALALANHIEADKIVRFYKNYGPTIFAKRRPSVKERIISLCLRREVSGLFESIYDNQALSTAVKKVFGETKTLREMYEQYQTAVCISTTDPKNCKPVVFKTPHHPQLVGQLDKKLWEVALATSAAPLFFPIVSLDSEYFVDGGLWANNPSLIALTEAIGPYYDCNLDDLSLLSVGNLNSYDALDDFKSLNKGLASWNKKLVTMVLDVQSAHVKQVMQLIFKGNPIKYYRIEDNIGDPQQLKNMSKLDNVAEENLKHLISRGRKLASEFGVKPELKYFFPEGR